MSDRNHDSTLFQTDGQAPAGGIDYPNGRHPDEYPKSKTKAKAAPDSATANVANPGATGGTPAPIQAPGGSDVASAAKADPPGATIEPGGFATWQESAPAVADDPFSPENLALSQDFGGMTETKRLLTVIRVGKPSKEAYVRTSPNPAHWIVGSVLELKSDGDETYWVTPLIRDALIGEPCLKAVRLILSVDRPGNPFFWKVGMPDPNGRPQPWVDSMMDAANVARNQWTRVAWNNSTRGYEVTVAKIQADPKWPTEPMNELLNIAFRGRIVTSLDHPVVQSLRGLV